ncbi:RHS repeat-associated protein [Nocardioides daedukensis]|uniref:RHS repeat-associated protein n=1 Tax=Nocardioides daedukensis TaxID=634462 RepID=A0A7Y9S0V1_9ACTN|nr:RHS repeat-associated core domain-containing protein [Nocardioides daedukensis]NYG60247.1 RHS repeat-associated protein [Nocardioides daedukensis]
MNPDQIQTEFSHIMWTNFSGLDTATTDPATGDGTIATYTEYTEYGLPRDPTTSRPDRYGWLGTHARENVGITGGLTLMGARLYNPVTGRFLSMDPVRGGNDNIYIYPPDPINGLDLAPVFHEDGAVMSSTA